MSRPTSKATRARPFRETRRHHSTEAAEDYSELIADLIEEQGEARTCTIAQELGVSHVTALRTIRRLQDEGYMVTAPHKPVELTAKG
ncbi:MAG: HTH domain-containing protein, partial [Bdellovibrionales bacterium]|nr:HTH domain-containing protein [Bdellovibrionales bacterium]